ncbi:MAG: chemotaxis response regulator protein-glutamate methylesterase [Verrucomicrobiota bacterium]
MSKLIRTLIVDDSAFVRKVVREMLSRSPYIEVIGAARDGQEALELVEEQKPDVVICDLLMPGMDGPTFVRQQMARSPVPVLILTAAPEDGEKALDAMDAGAVDIVRKPTALANDQLLEIGEELIEKIKAVAHTSRPRLKPISTPPPVIESVLRLPVKTTIVVIGISTGGPQALRYLLPQIPADFPVPIAIVLHMPVGYTELFAQKLDELSKIAVMEAKNGMALEPGKAILAQAGQHLILRRKSAGSVVCELAFAPQDTPHRPAADVLFQSAAECYGGGVLGLVMTGMGDDGKKGAAWIKSQGGTIITEAEQSCVIYGMPRSVVEAGLSDVSAPLDKMAQTIMEKL